ncbi:MAG TPA: group II intron reverse transcriptase/maturase [Candidatus Dormibacteraeota bacterium]|nr:group II intron reverse transcriptase/maturase [Candidatus Dormibacteraeota bacterium]
MNTDAPWPNADVAEARVLEIQTKLHRWATDDPNRRFNDLDNLVRDPAFLAVAWKRVRGNRGARTAGVDGESAYYVSVVRGEERFLTDLRSELWAGTFHPLPVRERMIPKSGGKRRRLGIPTVRDRVVQAALKLVLEPIFEAEFKPCSYGFRPGRRAHDAIAEIHYFTSRSYEWVVEGDIKACFDEIDHSALMDRMRERVGDKRVLGLVKAFLKSGILGEDGAERDTNTGTPQGGILSPLLSNIALSVLDEHFAEAWAKVSSDARETRRAKGLANYRLVRYADDFVVLVAGSQDHAESLRDESAAVLRTMGLTLSQTKTRIVHIDQGFDFLGFRIQRQQKRGAVKRFVYTYPSKAALASVKARVRTITRELLNESLKVLLHRLNALLRGWTNYFKHGVPKATFAYLSDFVWQRVMRWLSRKYHLRSWGWIRGRFQHGSWPTEGGVALFRPNAVEAVRFRWRGNRIPSPWAAASAGTSS